MAVHAKISKLANDLHAVIVLDEGEGHYETHTGPSRGGDEYDKKREVLFYGEREETVWICDRPKKTEPDTKKRRQAKHDLQKMYDDSKWYQFIVRHRIRRILK